MSDLKLKELLVHSLFLDMMGEAGFSVQKIDYGHKLQELVKNKITDYKDYLRDVVEHSRDFILVSDSPILMQVFFSEEKIISKNFDFPSYLGNALLIFITPFEPFFQISNVRKFCKNNLLQPLEKNEFVEVSEEITKKYKRILSTKFK